MTTKTLRPRQRRRILCVDDYAPGLEIRKLLLEHWGYAVATAASGEEGLALLTDSATDAVILDYTMPGMNGGELAKIVRTRWPGVRIIMLSGKPRIPAKAKARADAFLEKGGRSERLRSVLVELVGDPLQRRHTGGLLGSAKRSISRARLMVLGGELKLRKHDCS